MTKNISLEDMILNPICVSRENLVNKEIKKITFLDHQSVISKYMSSYTLNDSMLVAHEMGTGKTYVAIALIHRILNENSNITKAFIFAKNETMLKRFQNITSQYFPSEIMKHNIFFKTDNHWNTFGGSQMFCTQKENNIVKREIKLNMEQLKRKYSNSIIIIDEVHHLRNEKNSEVYRVFHLLLHSVINCKILLLSGTVMVDNASEIIDIMNLILPITTQLDKKEHFDTKFNITNKDKLLLYFTNKVSILYSKNIIQKKYIGDIFLSTKKENICLHKLNMGLFQNKAYLDKIKHKQYNILDKQLLKISLFYYPGSVYDKKNDCLDIQFKQFLYNKKSTLLQNIKKCSSKYFEIIRYILTNTHSPYNKGKCIFVHIRFVEQEGLLLFSKLLEQFGYIKATTQNMRYKSKKYCLFTAQQNNYKDTHILSLLKQFNHPRNLYGEYAQIIISSDICMEGYSFHHIQKIFICNPWYNFTRTQQIIARGIRMYSHICLKKTKHWNNQIEISLLVSISSNQHSIDLNMYTLCKQKYLSISKMNIILEQSSIPLSNLSNTRYFKGFESLQFDKIDALYQFYIFKYDSDDKQKCVSFEDFLKTFNIIQQNESQIKHILDFFNSSIFKKIQKLFSIQTSYMYHDLKLKLHISDNELLSYLDFIISNNIYLYNSYKIRSFLREHNNEYFLVNHIDNMKKEMNIYNRKYIKPFDDKTLYLEYTMKHLKYSMINYDMLNQYNVSMYAIIFRNMDKKYVNELLQKDIVIHDYNDNNLTDLQQFFKNYTCKIDNIIYFIYHYKHGTQYSDIKYNMSTKSFGRVLYLDILAIEKKRRQHLNVLQFHNPYQIYGKINSEHNTFYIVQTQQKYMDTRLQHTGRECKTLTKKKLIYILETLHIPYQKYKIKKDFCILIRNWMTQNMIHYNNQKYSYIVYDSKCGYHGHPKKKIDIPIFTFIKGNNLSIFKEILSKHKPLISDIDKGNQFYVFKKNNKVKGWVLLDDKYICNIHFDKDITKFEISHYLKLIQSKQEYILYKWKSEQDKLYYKNVGFKSSSLVCSNSKSNKILTFL